MSDEERRADHTDDPRKQKEGTGGYPESTPAGTEGGSEGKREGDEDDREQTTRKPGAAGHA